MKTAVNTLSAQKLVGDCCAILPTLPDKHFHLCITSPPYWNLRSYLPHDSPLKPLEIGSEATLALYIEHSVACFAQVQRVLRDDGCLVLNLGDCYSSDTKASSLPTKNLCMVPARVAIALQDNGWILRSQIPWLKRNALCESVEDRPGSAIEYLFLFSKAPRYYWDRYAIRKPPAPASIARNRRNTDWFFETWQGLLQDDEGSPLALIVNPVGTRIQHYAAYPPKLVEPFILAATSEKGCCPTCGAPLRRVIGNGDSNLQWQKQCGSDDTGEYHGNNTKNYQEHKAQPASTVKARVLEGMVEKKTLRWEPSCEHRAFDSEPCRVLDPFAGTSMTAQVATRLGRSSTMIELSSHYIAATAHRDAQGALAIL